jgi:superfamily II DNA or RNA helicase
MIKLRQYQEDAVDNTMAEVEMFGEKNVIIEAPTGSGKSVIISELCKKLSGNIVVVVNITPLVEQIANHLEECNIEFSVLKAGMEDKYNENHRIQLVMSQTFYARHENLNIKADYVIIDERHKEYNTERTSLLMNKLQPKSVIGLTATPFDQGGYALSDSLLINTSSVKSLTDEGFLSPVKYYVPKWSTELGLNEMRLSGSDYSGSAIDETFNNSEKMELVLKSMNQMNAKNKKTLVFCNSIEQCEMVTSFLKEDGYLADCVHSKKSSKENDVILESFKGSTSHLNLQEGNESIKCLISVSKLSTGFDVKDIELGVMLRPTKVRSLYLQTVGRITRIAKGKEFAEFLDLAGTTLEHGFHDEIYTAPEYGDKKERELVQSRSAAEEIKYIVEEEPTLVNRDKVTVFVKQLKEKQKSVSEMGIKDLMAVYEMSDSAYDIINVAHRIKEVKDGTSYKKSTVNWISDNWEMNLALYPEYRSKWLRALKTRAKNIVRDNKKLTSLYYFIDFLIEKKDEFYN